MNDRSIIHAPDPGGRGNWLDDYLPQNQVVPYQQQPQFINLSVIQGIIYRQRWLFGGVLFLALVVGLVATLIATPMYSAQATVTVEPNGSFIVEGQNLNQGVSSNQVGELLSTQVAIIQSLKLATTIAQENELGLRYDILGKDIDQSRPPNLSDAQWLEAKNSMVASTLRASVSAEMPSNNWVIPISFTSPDPMLAAEMANAYADAFVALDTSDQLADNEYARGYLQEQIQTIRARLSDAEQAANAYARDNSILIQGSSGENGETGITLTGSTLTSINARVAEARAKRIEAEQRWRAIQNLPAAQLPEFQANAFLQSLVSERASKQAELIELRQRYNDEFPQIANLLSQIEGLDRQISAASTDTKATARSNFIIAQRQEQALQQELNSLKGESLSEQDRKVEYGVLERESAGLQEQLRAVLERYNELSTASNVQSGAVSKLDPATVPGSPVSPSLAKNMALALVFGVAFAAGLAVLRESFDDRVRSLESVEERLGLPLLGHTPYVEEGDIEIEGSDRFSELMEAYASIRSTIDFALPRDQTVIQLTSSQKSEGKSTTAVILAELFANLGKKTLLVDADLRRPSVASLLDIERPKMGLMEVLLEQAPLDAAVIKGVHANLEILPVGEIPPNPTEIFASDHLKEFIEKHRDEYSMIIFDSCPVMGLADAPMLSRIVDASIFVLEANSVPFGQAKAAIRRMRSGGANMLGVILTKYRALEAGQSYYYQYGYYQYGKEDGAR